MATIKSSDEGAIGALERRALEGDAQAQYELGAAYHDGEGVRQDFERAVHWYAKACKQGQVDALFRLGLLTGAGEGRPADNTEAQRLLRQAAAQGHATAKLVLEHLLEIDKAAEAKMRRPGLG